MSSLDTVIRSVPMNPDGTPKDTSLVYAEGAPTPEATIPDPAPATPPAAEVPSDRFDPAAFRAALPKTDTARLASMSDMTKSSAGVQKVERQKPKVTYLGRGLAPIVYDLDMPFAVDDEIYETLTISSPTGEMYDELQKVILSHGSETAVFWLCFGGLDPDVVEAIHASDKMELNEVCLPFLPRLMQRQIRAAAEAKAKEEMEASSDTTGPAQG